MHVEIIFTSERTSKIPIYGCSWSAIWICGHQASRGFLLIIERNTKPGTLSYRSYHWLFCTVSVQNLTLPQVIPTGSRSTPATAYKRPECLWKPWLIPDTVIIKWKPTHLSVINLNIILLIMCIWTFFSYSIFNYDLNIFLWFFPLFSHWRQTSSFLAGILKISHTICQNSSDPHMCVYLFIISRTAQKFAAAFQVDKSTGGMRSLSQTEFRETSEISWTSNVRDCDFALCDTLIPSIQSTIVVLLLLLCNTLFVTSIEDVIRDGENARSS